MSARPPPSDQFLSSSERNNDAAATASNINVHEQHNLELQLLPSSANNADDDDDNNNNNKSQPNSTDENYATKLSLGSSSIGRTGNEMTTRTAANIDPKSLRLLDTRRSRNRSSSGTALESSSNNNNNMEATRLLKQGANEQLRMAMAEKAFAEEARQETKRQMELAEMEFANAKRIRQQAQTELERAQLLKEQSTKKINETISEITCHTCKQKFQVTNAVSVSAVVAAAVTVDETSPAMSYMSSATTDAEGE